MRDHSNQMAGTMKKLGLFRRLVIAAPILLASAMAAYAQQSFKTPTDAGDALVAAVRSGDVAKILAVLGPNAREIVSSGDSVADKNARESFVATYDAGRTVENKDDKTAILNLGKDGWPFPIPLVRKGDGWQFDSAAGKLEVLYRRVGRNELNTIDGCFAYVDAQNEYAQFAAKEFGTSEFAQRIISTVGKKDGLYWPAVDGKDDSPLGELIAAATDEGYTPGQSRIPYHGYYFKVLTKQGANAPGGIKDYVVKGKMTEGFALVAWPAEYGNSGVKTFMINQLGVLYEKDLGPGTPQIAAGLTAFNPDKSWQPYTDRASQ